MSLQRVCLHLTRRTTLVTWQQFWSCKKMAWPFWQSIFLVLAGSGTASVATTSQKENSAKRVSRRSGCAPSLSRKPMPFLSSFLCVRPLQYFKNGAKNAPGRPALLFEFGTFCGGGQAKIMPPIFSAGIVLTALPDMSGCTTPPVPASFLWGGVYMRFLHALRSSCVLLMKSAFHSEQTTNAVEALGIWTALANGCHLTCSHWLAPGIRELFFVLWLIGADFLPSCPVHRQWLDSGMVFSSLTHSTAELIDLLICCFNSFFLVRPLKLNVFREHDVGPFSRRFSWLERTAWNTHPSSYHKKIKLCSVYLASLFRLQPKGLYFFPLYTYKVPLKLRSTVWIRQLR